MGCPCMLNHGWGMNDDDLLQQTISQSVIKMTDFLLSH